MTPARGRPLSEERTDDILGVVLELLQEVGYDQLRMQDVADRAGAGLATIYRRWPTKQDLVRASLECDRAQEKFAVTDDPRADVRAFLARIARDASADGAQTIMGFLSCWRSEPEVADVFRETALARMHEYLIDRLAAELGDDFPDLELRATMGPAILFYKTAMRGETIDPDAMADHLTELLFAPSPVTATTADPSARG
jgi:AcrR family transcriptional regulator